MLHDDKDSELIGHGTGLRPERLAPRGTGHGRA
jgi:hypothetical protein